MKKIKLELTASELKVIASALRYTKAYKGIEVYETVLHRIVDQLTEGVLKYYVVQGILDEGICKSSKAVLVRAKSQNHAAVIAKAYFETEAGESFTPVAVGEATKNYGLCEVLGE